MWFRSIDRSHLVDALSGARITTTPLRSLESAQQLRDEKERIHLVYDKQKPTPIELPILVVTSQDEIRDFLAWTSTYIPQLTPFTAHSRVLDSESFEAAWNVRKPEVSDGVLQALVAVVITDSFLNSAQHDTENLPSYLPTTTRAFVMARAIALRLPVKVFPLISMSWEESRRLTHQFPNRPISDRYLWTTLAGIAEINALDPIENGAESVRLLVGCCRELLAKGDIATSTWRELSSRAPDLETIRQRMEGTRETRVIAFEAASKLLRDSRIEEPLGAFITGYLASQIDPGSLAYLPLLRNAMVHEMNPLHLSAPYWYATCTGLRSRGQVLDFSTGLGRWIARGLVEHDQLCDRPKCDISHLELKVLQSTERNTFSFRTSQQGSVTVELFPGVRSTISIGNRDFAQRSLFPDQERKPAAVPPELLQEFSQVLTKMNSLFRRLSAIAPPETSRKPGKWKKGQDKTGR